MVCNYMQIVHDIFWILGGSLGDRRGMEIRRQGSRQILLDTFYCFYNLIVSWNLYFRSSFNCIMKYFEYLNFIDFHYVCIEILVSFRLNILLDIFYEIKHQYFTFCPLPRKNIILFRVNKVYLFSCTIWLLTG